MLEYLILDELRDDYWGLRSRELACLFPTNTLSLLCLVPSLSTCRASLRGKGSGENEVRVAQYYWRLGTRQIFRHCALFGLSLVELIPTIDGAVRRSMAANYESTMPPVGLGSTSISRGRWQFNFGLSEGRVYNQRDIAEGNIVVLPGGGRKRVPQLQAKLIR